MKIELQGVAKRFRREWILRAISLQLSAPGRYAVTGPNGSGKSTFLKILSGHLTPSKGRISFSYDGQAVPITEVYQYLSFAAPYIELIEEFSLLELLQFHRQFKPFQAGLSSNEVIDLMDLRRARQLPLSNFSSGMKQRVKLALACCSETPLLLLDEPTTNLDEAGIDWYHSLIERFAKDRLVVVASNVSQDFSFCEEKIHIPAFKKVLL